MPDQTIDRMAIAFVYQWQSKGLMQALKSQRFTATIVDAKGGFLRQGMMTLIVGTSKRRMPTLFRLVRDYCPASTRYIPFEVDMELPWYPESEAVEVRVGGATVFVVPVEQFAQL